MHQPADPHNPQQPPPLPTSAPTFGQPFGMPTLTRRQKWGLFFTGLIIGIGLTYFAWYVVSPQWAKEILLLLMVMTGLKVAIGGALLVPAPTRMIGLGLVLSIPAVVLITMLRVVVIELTT